MLIENIENVFERKITQKDAGLIISNNVLCKPAYAEGFVIATTCIVT